jgi:hypothetical protein
MPDTDVVARSEIVVSSADYLRAPEAFFERMRQGATIVVESPDGSSRMVLSSEPVAALQLD